MPHLAPYSFWSQLTGGFVLGDRIDKAVTVDGKPVKLSVARLAGNVTPQVRSIAGNNAALCIVMAEWVWSILSAHFQITYVHITLSTA